MDNLIRYRGLAKPFCLGNFPVKKGDVMGSQGVLDTIFLGLSTSPGIIDLGTPVTDPVFGNNRQCTGRNAPFAVNAVFYYRNFWDGRAKNVFNGVTPFGAAGAESPTV